MKFRQRCINKLSRRDAEFYFDPGTIKDLSVFCSLVNLKALSFKDDFDLEMKLARYLQIMMILSSVSDDPRDERLVEQFLSVPFECEEIVKMRPPYKNPGNIDLIFELIRKRYPLPAFCEACVTDTETLEASVAKESTSEMNNILSFYSTPIVGMMAVMGIPPRDFHFMQELKDLLKFILQEHRFENSQHAKVMNWVVKFNIKKTA
ncbi:MAG: hypothetical protein H0V66_15375 [Bdellovibrionales bacterium]|nr:hypothetical protein [Bdellovibrionales bacterium]